MVQICTSTPSLNIFNETEFCFNFAIQNWTHKIYIDILLLLNVYISLNTRISVHAVCFCGLLFFIFIKSKSCNLTMHRVYCFLDFWLLSFYQFNSFLVIIFVFVVVDDVCSKIGSKNVQMDCAERSFIIYT